MGSFLSDTFFKFFLSTVNMFISIFMIQILHNITNSWIFIDSGRNCLLGNKKKIAKLLMRTFTCRSTFLYDLDHRKKDESEYSGSRKSSLYFVQLGLNGRKEESETRFRSFEPSVNISSGEIEIKGMFKRFLCQALMFLF